MDFSDRCFVFARFLGFRDFHTWVKKSVLSSIYLIHKPYIWQSREGEWKMGLGILDAWTFPDPKQDFSRSKREFACTVDSHEIGEQTHWPSAAVLLEVGLVH